MFLQSSLNRRVINVPLRAVSAKQNLVNKAKQYYQIDYKEIHELVRPEDNTLPLDRSNCFPGVKNRLLDCQWAALQVARPKLHSMILVASLCSMFHFGFRSVDPYYLKLS